MASSIVQHSIKHNTQIGSSSKAAIFLKNKLSIWTEKLVSGKRLALENQRLPVWFQVLAMCRGNLSAVTRILSECLWKGWKWWRGVKETNFLVYRPVYQYRYKQKFYNWLPVFFKKVQAVSNYLTNQKTFIRCQYFFSVIFLLPCDVLVTRICPTYRVMV